MKTFYTACFFGWCTFIIAQVGIGTDTPRGLLDINDNAGNATSGLVVPRIDNPANLINPQGGSLVNGTLVFDTTENCLKVYQNNAWTDCLGEVSTAVVKVVNLTSGFEGTYIQGRTMTTSEQYKVVLRNNTSSIANFSFNTADLTLSGVGASSITVSSVSIAAISLEPGKADSVVYQLAGTPSATGDLQGNWAKVSLVFSETISVAPAQIVLDCQTVKLVGNIYQGGSDVLPQITAAATSDIDLSDTPLAVITIPIAGITDITSTLTSFVSGVLKVITYDIVGQATQSGTLSVDLSVANSNVCPLNIGISPLSGIDFNGFVDGLTSNGQELTNQNNWVVTMGNAYKSKANNGTNTEQLQLTAGGVMEQSIQLPSNTRYSFEVQYRTYGNSSSDNGLPSNFKVTVYDVTDANTVLFSNSYSSNSSTNWQNLASSNSITFSTDPLEVHSYKVVLEAKNISGTNSPNDIRLMTGTLDVVSTL